MSDTIINSVLVIGNQVRISGRSRAGVHQVYFANPATGGTFIGIGSSHGAGDFDVTVGPFIAGTYDVVAGPIESNGFVNNANWSNPARFTIF